LCKRGMQMNQIYSKGCFKVYHSDDGYILHNASMSGFSHSHIKNYKACIWIINLSLQKKIPHNIPKYLLVSLIRVNDDVEYLRKLNELLEAKEKKQKNQYFNSNKGVRKKWHLNMLQNFSEEKPVRKK